MHTTAETESFESGQDQAVVTSVALALTAGLSPGAKLREKQCFTLQPNGVSFHGPLTSERWKQGMRALAWMKRSFHFWLADFINHGRQHLSKEEVEESIVQMEFASFDVDRALAITDYPEAARSEKLTSEHYFVLSRRGVKGDSLVPWIKLAEEHELTPVELDNSIAAGKLVKRKTAKSTRGIVTIEGFRMTFESWWRRVGKDNPVEKWETDRKREILEELKPAAALGLRLARELGVNLDDAA
jgi:hypothetical protein